MAAQAQLNFINFTLNSLKFLIDFRACIQAVRMLPPPLHTKARVKLSFKGKKCAAAALQNRMQKIWRTRWEIVKQWRRL